MSVILAQTLRVYFEIILRAKMLYWGCKTNSKQALK
jgi:hypothetical protein